MLLYGDCSIDNEALKRWVAKLSVDDIAFIDVGGERLNLTVELKNILKSQLNVFSNMVQFLKPEDDWRKLQGVLSTMFLNAFFRIGNNAIRVANYYECLLIPSNLKTYKKIIKGFDYQSTGVVHICNGTDSVAKIGLKSDLIWKVFYDYFINEGEYGDIIHTLFNHEMYLSIQLYDVDELSIDEISVLVNEILLRVSIEHDLDFTIAELDADFKLEGEDKLYISQFNSVEFEHIPVLYFNNALHSQDVRLAYLSYYQVLEYFFVRAQNYSFLDEFNQLSMSSLNHNLLHKTLQKYKNSLNERESLKLVLKRAIVVGDFKNWINQAPNRIETYCNCDVDPIDMSKSDEKIISKLSNRIYSFRCSIAHAKGDVDEYIAIPTISNDEIAKEIEHIKYIS